MQPETPTGGETVAKLSLSQARETLGLTREQLASLTEYGTAHYVELAECGGYSAMCTDTDLWQALALYAIHQRDTWRALALARGELLDVTHFARRADTFEPGHEARVQALADRLDELEGPCQPT